MKQCIHHNFKTCTEICYQKQWCQSWKSGLKNAIRQDKAGCFNFPTHRMALFTMTWRLLLEPSTTRSLWACSPEILKVTYLLVREAIYNFEELKYLDSSSKFCFIIDLSNSILLLIVCKKCLSWIFQLGTDIVLNDQVNELIVYCLNEFP